MSQATIVINGTEYDTLTGLPVSDTPATSVTSDELFRTVRVHPSQAVHQTTQKSRTLNRHALKHPVAAPAAAQPQPRPTITRSPAITKFAPHPTGAIKKPGRTMDIGPARHPLAVKAQKAHTTKSSHPGHRHAHQLATKAPAPKPSQVIKNEAIAEAMQKAPAHNHHAHAKPAARHRHLPHKLSVASASLALILLGGYFTYINMPNLSVRVAAAQAGINASYPSYHPDGYSLHGPVAYSDGDVSMKFASNSAPRSFTINQSKSNWDSSAVLANYVEQKSDGNYASIDSNGLTIYIYGNNAAWVNGGIFYKITGDAPLSNDQIRHIAVSM